MSTTFVPPSPDQWQGPAKDGKFVPPPVSAHEGPTKDQTVAQSLGITNPWVAAPLDALQGIGAGVLSIPRTLSRVAHAVVPAIPEIPPSYTEAPDSLAGKTGKVAEQAAEFLLPAGVIGKGARAVEGITAGVRGARALNLGARAVLEGVGAGATTLAQTGSPSEAATSAELGGAGSAAMQGVGAGVRALTPLVSNRLNAIQQGALDWAKARGIPLSVGQSTGNERLIKTEKGLIFIPGSGGRAQQFFQDQEQALNTTGRRLVGTTQPGITMNPYEAGDNLGTKVKSIITGAKSDADSLYGDLRNEYAKHVQPVQVGATPANPGNSLLGIAPTTSQPIFKDFELPVDVSKAKAKLKPIYDELTKTMPQAKKDMSPGYTAFKELMEGPDVMDAVTADRNLSALKSVARSGDNQYLNSRSQGLAKWAIGNVEKDFGAALDAADPSLGPKLAQARDAVRKQHTVAELLNSLPDEPAQLYERLTTAGDRTYKTVAALNAQAPDQMRQVGRTFLDGIFDRATKEGEFKAARMMADWERLGPNTKRLLFGSPQNITDLDRFFLAAKRLSSDVNPSSSGKFMYALGGAGAMGVAVSEAALTPGDLGEKAKALGRNLGLVAGSAASMNGISRLLLTPGGARIMTSVLKAPPHTAEFRQAMNGLMSLAARGNGTSGVSVTAPDGSVHQFDSESQAQQFREAIKQ